MAAPFVLLVVADSGGRRPAATASPIAIDRDRLDAVMARLAVAVDVPVGGARTPLTLGGLDALHPDALLRRLPEPAQAEPPVAATAPAPRRDARPAPAPPTGNVLETILREHEGRPGMDPGLEDFVRRVAEPALVRSDAATAASREATDAGRVRALRAVLRDPAFRRVEALWRGLDRLVRAVETGPGLEIRLVDAPHDRLPGALDTALGVPGTPAPAAVIVPRRFGPTADDLGALAGLARVAARVGAPLVADASPGLLGLADAAELGDASVRARLREPDAWAAFRREPVARHVALCLPRPLLRLPYGPSTAPIETFAFEEAVSPDDPDGFLWGSAALAFAEVLARGFAADGAGFDVAAHAHVDDLPVAVRGSGADAEVVPCVEATMSDATIRAVLDRGLVVLAAVRGTDRADFWGIGMVDGGPFPTG